MLSYHNNGETDYLDDSQALMETLVRRRSKALRETNLSIKGVKGISAQF